MFNRGKIPYPILGALITYIVNAHPEIVALCQEYCQGPDLTGSRGNESRGVRLANCLMYANTAPLDSFSLLSP
jgi:hypothetical protein